jgi:hypothetical protein
MPCGDCRHWRSQWLDNRGEWCTYGHHIRANGQRVRAGVCDVTGECRLDDAACKQIDADYSDLPLFQWATMALTRRNHGISIELPKGDS